MEQIIQVTLVPLVLLIVQAIKTISPRTGEYAIAIVLVVALGLSTLLVDWSGGWQMALLNLLTSTVLIASGASGVYSWGKKGNLNVEIADYSDEK